MIVNKKCCREKLVSFARKKQKTVLNVTANANNANAIELGENSPLSQKSLAYVQKYVFFFLIWQFLEIEERIQWFKVFSQSKKKRGG
jgi:hypothetical protein